MGRRTFTAEQIIGKLRQAEVLLSQGDSIGEASRKMGITEQTYYRWRKEYGGLRVTCPPYCVPPKMLEFLVLQPAR